MKNMANPTLDTATKAHFRLLAIATFSLSLLTLSACQKEPEAEVDIAQPAAVTTNIEDQQKADKLDEQPAVQNEREVNLSALEDESALADNAANTQAIAPNPEQAIKGTQITDVTYRSNMGENLSVVFETSATGVLNAIVTLPNKPKMTLSAPGGQGNNPTYRSADGTIELISHGGGSSIDLLQNGKVTNFEATSAEAEVVTQN